MYLLLLIVAVRCLSQSSHSDCAITVKEASPTTGIPITIVLPKAGFATVVIGQPVIPRGGQAGPLIGMNSDKGSIYLITMDGLFIQSLGDNAAQTTQRVHWNNLGTS